MSRRRNICGWGFKKLKKLPLWSPTFARTIPAISMSKIDYSSFTFVISSLRQSHDLKLIVSLTHPLPKCLAFRCGYPSVNKVNLTHAKNLLDHNFWNFYKWPVWKSAIFFEIFKSYSWIWQGYKQQIKHWYNLRFYKWKFPTLDNARRL